MNILVIDDSLPILQYTCACIKDEGHHAIAASSGSEALSILEQQKPDLILLDIIMPDMDGYEIAKKIRTILTDQWIPIIFLSAKIEDEDIVKGIEVGADDYLTKPISQTVLMAKIKAMQRITEIQNKLLHLTKDLEKANSKLESLTHIDGLTGISNRRYFDECIEKEWRLAKRNGTAVSVLMIDADFFKQYNDTNGHQKGDDCLKVIATSIMEQLHRPGDMAYRYGGEEFVVILPDTNAEGTLTVGMTINNAIKELGIQYNSPEIDHPVTVSIGCALMIPYKDDAYRTLIERADKALYEAKENGRDQVISHSSIQDMAA